jgi:hypothetical protein
VPNPEKLEFTHPLRAHPMLPHGARMCSCGMLRPAAAVALAVPPALALAPALAVAGFPCPVERLSVQGNFKTQSVRLAAINFLPAATQPGRQSDAINKLLPARTQVQCNRALP